MDGEPGRRAPGRRHGYGEIAELGNRNALRTFAEFFPPASGRASPFPCNRGRGAAERLPIITR